MQEGTSDRRVAILTLQIDIIKALVEAFTIDSGDDESMAEELILHEPLIKLCLV